MLHILSKNKPHQRPMPPRVRLYRFTTERGTSVSPGGISSRLIYRGRDVSPLSDTSQPPTTPHPPHTTFAPANSLLFFWLCGISSYEIYNFVPCFKKIYNKKQEKLFICLYIFIYYYVEEKYYMKRRLIFT